MPDTRKETYKYIYTYKYTLQTIEDPLLFIWLLFTDVKSNSNEFRHLFYTVDFNVNELFKL